MTIETKAGTATITRDGAGHVLVNGLRTDFVPQQLRGRGRRAIAVFGGGMELRPLPIALYPYAEGDEAGRRAAEDRARREWTPRGL